MEEHKYTEDSDIQMTSHDGEPTVHYLGNHGIKLEEIEVADNSVSYFAG